MMHFGSKGPKAESRRVNFDPAGNVTVLVAYCNVIINPLIYIFRYDVVKGSLINWVTSTGSLINWVKSTAAKLRNRHPPATD